MKPIWLFLLFLSHGLFLRAADMQAQEWSAQHLREMVVASPDSVLTILDRAEAARAASLPPFRIAILRGMAYNEKHLYSLVERYALEALGNDSIMNYPKERLNAMTMLAVARSYYGDPQQCVETSIEAINLARQLGNKPAELNILTTMAKTSFRMGDRKRGYEYLDEVIDQENSLKSSREMADASTAYGVKVIELYEDDRFEEALDNGHRRLALIDRIERSGGAPEGYADQQRAYAYARIASSALKSGKPDEAAKAFDAFMSTSYGQTVIGRSFITDYLIESQQWGKVIEFTRPLLPLLEQSDTINNDFWSVLFSNAEAEYGLGNYKEGFAFLKRASAITDSLYARERDSKAQELATIFSLNEKEIELQKSEAEAQRKHILLLMSSGIGILALIILAILWMQYRATLRRNKIAAHQIDELVAQREKLLDTQCCHNPKNPDRESEFQHMERIIRAGKIFTNPNLNRDSLAEACGMSRARLIQVIQDNTGLSPNDYINRHRIEYSIKLIQEHPEWTIDAIAEESGYVRRATYYSHFNKICGITPAQYRKSKQSGSI